MEKAWTIVWAQAGRVPLRQKIIGIVVASLLILGASIAWWVRNSLGGWLSYLLSEERVAQAMSVGTRGVFIITFLAMMVGLVVAWMLTWVLTRPVLHMTRVAQKVEGGDLAVRAPVWANDEIGELGRTFNAMIDSLARSQEEMEAVNERLRRRNEELAILYELAGMACQTPDTQQVLACGLERALEITGGLAGFIALQDGRRDTFRIATQIHELPLGDIETLLGDSLESLHHIALADSFLRVDDLSELTDIAPSVVENARQHDLRCMLALPIQGKTIILGSLVIFYDAKMVGRSSIDSLLTAICNQLGMSLDNLALWQEVRRKEAMRARLLAKIVSAQEEERQRISRELHDETGQALTSLLVQLKVLDRLPDIRTMREHVVALREIVASSLDEVRRLSLDLRPAVLDDLGLIPALEWYLNERVKPRGLSVTFESADTTDWSVPRETEVVLYRVAQEALTNISRYANASHATVKVENLADCLQLIVEDDGQGFDVDEVLGSAEHGLGLLGMKERVELIGGRFEVVSTPDEGTRIMVEVETKRG